MGYNNTAAQVVLTTAGRLKKVSLEEFLSEIPLEVAGSVLEQYNTCTSYGDSESSNVPDGELPREDDSLYMRYAVALNENSQHQQLMHILDQVSFADVSEDNVDRNDRVELAAVLCMENYGIPTHLVEITWNCYGIFCMDDFKYKILNPTKGAVICTAPKRNIIFRAGY